MNNSGQDLIRCLQILKNELLYKVGFIWQQLKFLFAHLTGSFISLSYSHLHGSFSFLQKVKRTTWARWDHGMPVSWLSSVPACCLQLLPEWPAPGRASPTAHPAAQVPLLDFAHTWITVNRLKLPRIKG